MSEARGRRGLPAGRRGSIQPGTGTGRGRAGRGRAVATPTQSEVGTGSHAGGGDDASVASTLVAGSDASVKVLTEKIGKMALRQRPGRGTQGRPIQLTANHFNLMFRNGEVVVQHYRVEISHERRKLIREEINTAFWTVVARNKQVFQNPFSIAFDGGNMSFCTETLIFPNGSNKEHTFTVDVLLPNDDRTVTINCYMSMVGRVHVDPKKVAQGLDREQTPLQVMEVVFRQGRCCPYNQSDNPLTRMVAAGRSFFFPPDPRADMNKLNLGNGRMIWQGMFMSSHVSDGWKPLINIDSSQTAFYQKIGCIEFCQQVISGTSRDAGVQADWDPGHMLNTQAFLDDRQRNQITKELKGLRVHVLSMKGDNAPPRTFKVVGMSRDSAANLKFTLKTRTGANGNGNGNGHVVEERTCTVQDYFREIHGYELKYPHMPCLQVGDKRKEIFMPIEICTLLIGQKCNRKLNESMTTTMIRFACTPAPERQRRIEQAVHKAGLLEDQWISQFGMKIDPKMVSLNGRVLNPPQLAYGGGRPMQPNQGQWRSDNFQASTGSEVNNWGLIAFCPSHKQRELETFCNALVESCVRYGIKFKRGGMPHTVQYVQGGSNVEQQLQSAFGKCVEDADADRTTCDLVVIVLDRKNSMFYDDVKRVSEINMGIMTQCVVMKNIRPNAMTMHNIALKINAKLGGTNQTLATQVNDPWQKALFEVPTLILGVDVTHPGPMDQQSPSVASLVGNIDLFGNIYQATIKVQKYRREQLVNLCDPVRERLKAFFQNTNVKPARIIVYRDGVSDGQFQDVMREEMLGIRKACMTLDENYRPPITFIVVQKRHHTRLFCQNPRDASGKSQNVPPGTIVDQTITHPEDFDFFMCSHFGIQGVSKPTHYFVLHDDSEFSADHIQMFTWYLTHIYTRCPRSVSIPAPVYYADLACTRARSHLHSAVFDEHSDSISVTTGGRRGGPDAVAAAAVGPGGDGGDSSDTASSVRKAVMVLDKIKEKMYYV